MPTYEGLNEWGFECWIVTGGGGEPYLCVRKRDGWLIHVRFLRSAHEMIKRVRPADAEIDGNDRKEIFAAVRRDVQKLIQLWNESQQQED